MTVDASEKKEILSGGIKGKAGWIHTNAEGIVCRANGYAFLKNEFIDGKMLAEAFLKQMKPDFKIFLNLVKQLNGSFALIVKDGNKVFAAADRIRSYPIFYGIRKDSLHIASDARSVKEAIQADTVNPYAVEEFLTSGYVSGDDTLYDGIKQLRSGEALCFDLNAPGKLETERYYNFYNRNKETASVEELIDAYDGVLKNVFNRLIKSAGGRKIIVPLSGGVDSRLIVSMLKRLGYGNVLCLSYGVPNNWETEISRKVAEKIGYEWRYVPYSRKKWHDVYKSGEWREYFYSMDNLSSLANGDDWIALGELKQNKEIPEDAVLVPGHTGDFITGGHLQYVFGGREGRVSKEELLNSILKKHYGLWPSRLKRAGTRDYLAGRLCEYFENLHLESEQDIADAYELWEWQERQAKFIVNSVRTYDFWGFDWRIPFWDSEVMDFWSKVPLEQKIVKKLYLAYLKQKDEFGLFNRELIGKKLHRRRLFGGKFRKFTEYFRDTKGLYGIHNYFVVTFMNFGRRNANSILVKDYLKTVLGKESGNIWQKR